MAKQSTIEWTNWSLLDRSPITTAPPGPPTAAILDFGWEDGWFYSIGGEYDVNDKLTVRAGVAYEESPIQDAEARLLQVPDADRIWASIGATYKWSESTLINVAYSHVFVEEADFIRYGSSPFSVQRWNSLMRLASLDAVAGCRDKQA